MITRSRLARALAVLHAAWLGVVVTPCLWFPLYAQEKQTIPNAMDRDELDSELDQALNEGAVLVQMGWDFDVDMWTQIAYGTFGSRSNLEQMVRQRVRNTLNLVDGLSGISAEVRDKVRTTAEHELQRLDVDINALISQAPKRPTEEEYRELIRKLWEITEPVKKTVQRGLRDGRTRSHAVWEKVLFSNLTAEQKQLFEKNERQRMEYCNKIERLETLLKVSRVLGLSSQQLKDFEAMADANPEAWTSIVLAWTTLSAMPQEQQREHFTESQRNRLTLPLEYADPVVDPVLDF